MGKSNRDRDDRPTSVTREQVRAVQIALDDRKLGRVSIQEATDTVCALAKAAAKVPFPEGHELRAVRLHAWRRDYGAFRFCYPRWWTVYLGVG